MPEGSAGQARPAERVLAFFDPLFRRATAVVELDHALGRPAQVGDDEADAGIQLTLVPLDFGHHPTRSRPTLGSWRRRWSVLRRPPDRPRQQMANPSLEHVVGRQADRILDALLLQPLVDLRLGEGCIGAEVEVDATRDSG